MENNIKLNKNISIGYIYNFFMYFRITSAIWVLYLSFKGVSLAKIGILEAIFHVTCFLCEIPTGAVADMYGRKFSIILGRVCAIVDTMLMIFSSSMIGYTAAFIFSGLSYTLNSGSGESLIYDSLKQMNKTSEYKKIAGTTYFLSEIGQGTAVVLGGILSDKRFLYAYLLSLTVEIIALMIAFKFKEPQVKEEKENVSFISQVKESISVLKTRKLVMYLIMFFMLICAAGNTVYFYCQKYFDSMSFSKTLIAIIYTADSIINALSSKYSYKIESVIKRSGIIILLPILNVVGIIGIAFAKGYAVIIFFLVTSFIQGIGEPLFSEYINSLIPSEYRATILSIESVFFSMSMIIMFPLTGFIGEKLGLSYAFIIMAVLFIPSIIAIMYKIKKQTA